jgi:hypothetical protein
MLLNSFDKFFKCPPGSNDSFGRALTAEIEYNSAARWWDARGAKRICSLDLSQSRGGRKAQALSSVVAQAWM